MTTVQALPIGFFHKGIVKVQTAAEFKATQFVDEADMRTAWEFFAHLLKAVPYRIHTILTDNSIQFAAQLRNRNTDEPRQMRFDMICEANDIEHGLFKPINYGTNGHEGMSRTI